MEITIPETIEKGNRFIPKRFFVPVLIVLAGILAFGIGKLVFIEQSRESVTLESIPMAAAAQVPVSSSSSVPTTKPVFSVSHLEPYVGARGGTSYYLPSCSGAKRIAEKNKIWFQTKEEAERLGYLPAKTCKGL